MRSSAHSLSAVLHPPKRKVAHGTTHLGPTKQQLPAVQHFWAPPEKQKWRTVPHSSAAQSTSGLQNHTSGRCKANALFSTALLPPHSNSCPQYHTSAPPIKRNSDLQYATAGPLDPDCEVRDPRSGRGFEIEGLEWGGGGRAALEVRRSGFGSCVHVSIRGPREAR